MVEEIFGQQQAFLNDPQIGHFSFTMVYKVLDTLKCSKLAFLIFFCFIMVEEHFEQNHFDMLLKLCHDAIVG